MYKVNYVPVTFLIDNPNGRVVTLKMCSRCGATIMDHSGTSNPKIEDLHTEWHYSNDLKRD
jgi:ribosomal protein S27AE